MLERNRGARRDRTRNIIDGRVKRRIEQDLDDLEIRGGYFWGIRRGGLAGPASPEEYSIIQHKYKVQEGRRWLFDNHCGDCYAGTGKCDYCGPGKYRHRTREHAILDDDLRAWKKGEHEEITYMGYDGGLFVDNTGESHCCPWCAGFYSEVFDASP